MFRSFDISLSGVEAARLRMEACSSNLANAASSAREDGSVYRLLHVTQREAGTRSELPGLREPHGVYAQIEALQGRPRLEYDPDHPDADEQGFVRYPDVDLVTEMTELIAARRAYEAGLTAWSESRQMFYKTLEIGR